MIASWVASGQFTVLEGIYFYLLLVINLYIQQFLCNKNGGYQEWYDFELMYIYIYIHL